MKNDDGVAAVLRQANETFAVESVADPVAIDRLDEDGDGFDCVITDRDVSSRAVRDLLETVRERWPAFPFVVVTDPDDTPAASDAVEAGATGTLRWSERDEMSRLLAHRVRNAVAASASRECSLTPVECQAVFKHAQCGVLLAEVDDGEFRYYRCNVRMTELVGMPVDDIVGYTPTEAFGRDVGREIEARYRECLDRGEPMSYTVEGDFPCGQAVRDGHVRPVATGDGTERLLVFVQEVTREREREAELRQSKRRLRALFEQSPDMVNIHGVDGRIIDCNPRICEKTGYDETTLTDMYIWDLDQESDPDRARTFWRSMDPGDRGRSEGTFECKDGSTFPVEVNVRRLSEDDPVQFMAISRDVSDQQARERELREKNARLEEFASVLSHDLRNPLQVLRGALDGAAATGEQAHFDRGHRAIDRMEDMISDTLALARQGNTVEELDTVSLGEVVEGCWENVQTDEATLFVERDLRIRASEIRLKQLVENLLRNAIEHGGDDDVRIRVGALEGGFYVADDGHGVSAEDRERVFESGYSTAPSGTGFGLAIVEGIVDAHGWTVTLSKGEDGGARFEFTGVTVV